MSRGSSVRRRSGPAWTVALIAGACAAGLGVVGCGGDGDGTFDAEYSLKATVVLKDDAYHPPVVRIPVGSRVTWVNRDSNGHTVETAGVGFFEFDRGKLDRQNRFDLHTLQNGEAESEEFDTPGTYRYSSSFDPEMRGVVEVVDSSR
jgi:plastocyanin